MDVEPLIAWLRATSDQARQHEQERRDHSHRQEQLEAELTALKARHETLALTVAALQAQQAQPCSPPPRSPPRSPVRSPVRAGRSPHRSPPRKSVGEKSLGYSSLSPCSSRQSLSDLSAFARLSMASQAESAHTEWGRESAGPRDRDSLAFSDIPVRCSPRDYDERPAQPVVPRLQLDKA